MPLERHQDALPAALDENDIVTTKVVPVRASPNTSDSVLHNDPHSSMKLSNTPVHKAATSLTLEKTRPSNLKIAVMSVKQKLAFRKTKNIRTSGKV